MSVTEMLERIEKLPVEWRHPSSGEFGFSPLLPDHIALDLHLRHITEKLNRLGIESAALQSGHWSSTAFLAAEGGWSRLFSTWAEATLSAAEAVIGRIT